MTRVVLRLDPKRLGEGLGGEDIPVLLYGAHTSVPGAGLVGNDLRDRFSRLAVPPSRQAMDLVAVAMAITAADTFVLRDDTADGWRRDIEIDLPVTEPDRWRSLTPLLSKALNFLSGDSWTFVFRGGGLEPPSKRDVHRREVIDPSKIDAVALFSGGLDSGLGVMDLMDGGIRPLLVSHAPRGDKTYQGAVASLLPWTPQRFEFNSYPSREGVTEITTRTRSFLFLTFAALVAQAVRTFRGPASINLYMCENGLIALNPPLTARRIGALSTRTAHPHYLSLLQELFDAIDLGVRIINPHRHETKGEMLARRANQANIAEFATATVSCGNWKRKNMQCGRCWPCSIRRSSFHRAGLSDGTEYDTDRLVDALAEDDYRDDVVSIHTALKRRYDRGLRSWVMQTGPLPQDLTERTALFSVVERGMDELESFFASHGLSI
ncbi:MULTISPECIES: Qat anti-phage system QueC-like protein QatC [unclassified Novosphingobium]|uniref:Qat anti-phage system QueC-like protein QatC n=1 Tax=unclassified Novosphingobium TaxID=2644732 RepID=UPI001358E9CC|nr:MULTISPECIES: Qat anti-phage system QueC-like protein QatC [unclassified Novosphingobium]